MKNLFESLIGRAAEGRTLSDSERERIRTALREYARIQPIRTPVGESAIPSPFMDELRGYFMRPAAAFAALVLVVGTGFGGVAYAAEGALPGDTLYSVKVNVTEPVRLALVADSESKAALHRKFAETRISEAAALAEQGRLTHETQAELAARFENDSAKGTDESDSGIRVAFEAKLAAYETVLEQIDEKKSSTSTLPIRAAIRGRIALAEPQAPAATRAMLFTASLKQAPAERNEKDVQDLDANAELALQSSLDTVAANALALDATTTSRAKNEIERASKLAEKGRQLLKAGNREAAYEAFQESLNAATRVEVFTKAATTLNVNPFGTSTPAEATSTASTTIRTRDSLRERLPFRR